MLLNSIPISTAFVGILWRRQSGTVVTRQARGSSVILGIASQKKNNHILSWLWASNMEIRQGGLGPKRTFPGEWASQTPHSVLGKLKSVPCSTCYSHPFVTRQLWTSKPSAWTLQVQRDHVSPWRLFFFLAWMSWITPGNILLRSLLELLINQPRTRQQQISSAGLSTWWDENKLALDMGWQALVSVMSPEYTMRWTEPPGVAGLRHSCGYEASTSLAETKGNPRAFLEITHGKDHIYTLPFKPKDFNHLRAT